jgi:hypothetical protein
MGIKEPSRKAGFYDIRSNSVVGGKATVAPGALGFVNLKNYGIFEARYFKIENDRFIGVVDNLSSWQYLQLKLERNLIDKPSLLAGIMDYGNEVFLICHKPAFPESLESGLKV